MGRLTERDEKGKARRAYNISQSYDDMLEKLAHYEDLEEQGRLIEVIRCKDCWHEQYCKQAQYLGTDGYCSKAEPKELG